MVATGTPPVRVTSTRSSRMAAATCAVGVASVLAVALTTHADTRTETVVFSLAKGLQHYSVATDSPHPPGYPLVVLTAHLFTWTGSILNAYLSVAVLAAIATIVITFLLGRELFGARAGAIAVLALIASPLFLYYSGIVSVYLTEAAMAPAIALIAHRVARRADSVSAFLLFPVLALGGGFRPTMLLLMLPVCAVGIIIGRPPVGSILIGALIAVTIVASWSIPMVLKSGGWHAYWQASQSLYDRQGKNSSLLFGASLHLAIHNLEVALAATAMVALPAAAIIVRASRRRRSKSRGREDVPVTRRIGAPARWILGAWFVPYAVVYFAVQLGKPGYVLAYLPLAAVLAGGLVAMSPRALPVAGGIAFVLILVFLTLPQWPLPWRLDAFFPTAHAVHVQDQDAQGLKSVGQVCPRASCTIVSLDPSKRYWYHDAESLVRWYSDGARPVPVGQVENSVGTLENMEAYWVGVVVPAAVEKLAIPVATFGTWQVFRSSPATTDKILASNI